LLFNRAANRAATTSGPLYPLNPFVSETSVTDPFRSP
jgi:hypothetical protein